MNEKFSLPFAVSLPVDVCSAPPRGRSQACSLIGIFLVLLVMFSLSACVTTPKCKFVTPENSPGPVVRQDLACAISKVRGPIHQCYETFLARGNGVGPAVKYSTFRSTAQLDVAPSGDVGEVSFDPPLSDTNFTACLSDKFKSMKFPATQTSAKLTYPFVFEPF